MVLVTVSRPATFCAISLTEYVPALLKLITGFCEVADVESKNVTVEGVIVHSHEVGLYAV